MRSAPRNDWESLQQGSVEDLPDPFDQANVDGFKGEPEPKTRPVLPHTFGTPEMWATSSRAERRAAARAQRKKGNK